MSQIKAIYPNAGITKNTVELEIKMFAFVFLRDNEGFPVPTDTGLRIFVTDSLITVAMTCQ